jgi:hypothetical protein
MNVPKTPSANGSRVPPWPILTGPPFRFLLEFAWVAFGSLNSVESAKRGLSESRSFIDVGPDGYRRVEVR